MKVGRFLKYTAICLILTFCFLSVKCTDEESQVIVLEDANFDEEVAKHQFLLIEFYAPWCGHCKSLEPEYNKAAQMLKEQDSDVHLAKVDATENIELAKRFTIQGYPTLKFLKNGQYYEYMGGRTAEEIVQWVNKKSGPPSQQLNSVEEFDNFRTSADFVLVYFGSEDSEKFNFFKAAADKYDYLFGHSFDEALNTHFNVQDNIVLFKNFDELRNDFNGELTEKSFDDFLNLHSIPLVGRLTDRVIEVIFDKNKAGFFYIRNDDSSKDVEFDHILRRFAPAYKGEIVFVTADIKDEVEERFAEYFGITEKNLPQIRIVNAPNDEDIKSYVFDKEIEESGVYRFIQDFLENKLSPTYKSEPVPETQDEAVYKVVGKSFNDVVINNDKNVLIEFYAPWCGHCKKFAPVYEEVAQAFNAENSNVLVAKMDATENEVEGLDISGFPTIKFYKAGDKSKPFVYKGDRGKWDVYDWVKERIDPTYQKPDRSESSKIQKEETRVEDAHKEDL